MGKLIIIAGLVITLLLIQGCTLLFLAQEQEPTQPEKKIPLKKQIINPSPPTVQLTEAEQPLSNISAIPDFAIALSTGETISKNSVLQQKALVIYFFTTYCTECMREMEELRESYSPYKNKIRFIAMSIDEQEDETILQQFKKEHPITSASIDLALRSNTAVIFFQATHPGIKIAVSKDNELISQKEETRFDQNDWKDIFESLA